MTDRLEISGEAKEKIRAFRKAAIFAYKNSFHQRETDAAQLALESHIAELEKDRARLKKIVNAAMEAGHGGYGAGCKLCALVGAYDRESRTPESPAVSASSSGGD